MADLISNAREWYLRNLVAPQTGQDSGLTDQFFQYRQTGVPGVIATQRPGVYGQQITTNPAGVVDDALKYGPKTDLDTITALRSLRDLWAQRAASHPQEGMIYVDPRAQTDPGVYAHEATHSLYDQGITPQQSTLLNNLAVKSGFDYGHDPRTKATEGLAYTVEMPTPGPGSWDSRILGPILDTMRENGRTDIANQILKLYQLQSQRSQSQP